MSLIKQFLRDEQATTAIEYALIGALVSVAIVAGARAIGTSLQAKFYGPISNNLT